MNIYTGTIGQLIIVELFVLWIWFKVLIDAVKARDSSLNAKRLLMTSLGLVLNAVAIGGLMVVRLYQYYYTGMPYISGVIVFYVILAVSNFLFILSASIGKTPKLFYWFVATTVLWTLLTVWFLI